MFNLDPSPLLPVQACAWECPPHDDDPAWPALFMRALDEQTRQRWHTTHAEAQAWETDPAGATLDDRIHAEMLAREWLRSMA